MSDMKRRGKRPKHRGFYGNKYVKNQKGVCSVRVESAASNHSSDSSDSDIEHVVEPSTVQKGKQTQTTPSCRSAMKIYKMYDVFESVGDSPEDSTDSKSDTVIVMELKVMMMNRKQKQSKIYMDIG